ncbi:MAG: hypothetical protein Q9227_002076 [Pyrenula ochraceoflavens]
MVVEAQPDFSNSAVSDAGFLASDGVPPDFDAVIVGASWAGIWTLYKLKHLGLRVLLIESYGEVGGVWHYTKYPGCRVDTEVPFYEFSMPELWKEWNWTQRFPSREEIGKYLSWVCDRLDLRKHILFNTTITAAHWQSDLAQWSIFAPDGRLCRTQFFIPCSGYSTIPYIPAFPGAETFQGIAFHSSRWPSDLSLEGKKLGVIGTGASGLQIIEAAAPHVSHLTVFQRTPNLATPMRQHTFTPESRAAYKASYPSLFASRRLTHFGVNPLTPESQSQGNQTPRPHTSDTPSQRHSFYTTLYAHGGLSFWFRNYTDLLTSPASNLSAYAFWRSQTLPRIHDPKLARILAPETPPHWFGTKRPSLENAYFETFERGNVEVVDLRGEPIKEVRGKGVVTMTTTTTTTGGNGRGKEEGESLYECDVLCYATGFDSITGSLLRMDVRGCEEVALAKKWDRDLGPDDDDDEGDAAEKKKKKNQKEGVKTYLGLATAGFPNMFFPMGPQAPTALGITPHMAEVQGDWVAGVIGWMRENGYRTVEARREKEEEWKGEVEGEAERGLFGGTKESWYMGGNVPGMKGEALCWFGGVAEYVRRLEKETREKYGGFVFGKKTRERRRRELHL